MSNSNIKKQYKEITKEYADDYFCKNTEKLIKNCILFIYLLKLGKFEYDTALGDGVLLGIKEAVNKIDI